ncbi:hypothetical protein D9M68_457190 [compost metagenome]
MPAASMPEVATVPLCVTVTVLECPPKPPCAAILIVRLTFMPTAILLPSWSISLPTGMLPTAVAQVSSPVTLTADPEPTPPPPPIDWASSPSAPWPWVVITPLALTVALAEPPSPPWPPLPPTPMLKSAFWLVDQLLTAALPMPPLPPPPPMDWTSAPMARSPVVVTPEVDWLLVSPSVKVVVPPLPPDPPEPPTLCDTLIALVEGVILVLRNGIGMP